MTGCLLITIAAMACSPSPAEPPQTPATETKACTQEAKVCPDGTAVSRTGPHCEFAPCPDASASAPPAAGEGKMCAQDVRECPDGSFVSRKPPSCDFAPCAPNGAK